MGFTTTVFFFVVLPIFFILYFLSDFISKKNTIFRKFRLQDIFIILFSLVFYACTGIKNMGFLIIFIIFIYIAGFCINKSSDLYLSLPIYKKDNNSFIQKRYSFCKILFFGFILLTLLVLFQTKYASYCNDLGSRLGINLDLKTSYLAPVGISFIIFSAISYLSDIKNKKIEAGNFIDCALYITFFPKILSGPIVLYRNFIQNSKNKIVTSSNIVKGINLICTGFIKKLLLADFFGKVVSDITYSAYAGLDNFTIWIAAILFTMQIYYDFAGYSDVAIGISKIIGFDFDKNFNFPYRSLSIKEFWRRWHISLGMWFKEYVYIPLGGNRKGIARTLINLGIIFILTGIWHGAGINYLVWGVLNGFIVICDTLLMKKDFYKKIPSFIKWVLTLFIIIILWTFFRFSSFKDSLHWILKLFKKGDEIVSCTWQYFLTNKVIFMFILSFIGATILGNVKLQEAYNKITQKPPVFILQEFVLLILLIISIVAMVNSGYSPFIYFQY